MTSTNIRKEQAMETKKKLIASARTLFAQYGYRGTTVRMINQNIQMADGLLYHYFPKGKKELLQVMTKTSVQQINAELTKDIQDYLHIPTEEALELFYQQFDHVIANHMDVIKILIKDGDAMKLIEREELLEILQERKQALTQYFELKIQRKEMKSMNCESASEIFMSLLMNHLLAMVLSGEDHCMGKQEKRQQLFHYLADMWNFEEFH